MSTVRERIMSRERDPLRALRLRLERAELIHLREHVEELRAQLDAVTVERDDALARASYAEDLAESWQRDALSAIEQSGMAHGLTIGGHIVAVQRQGAAS